MFNRNFIFLVTSGIIMGAPMPMLILLGGLAGITLAPNESLATLAMSVQILAGVVVTGPISLFMAKYGRRSGFLVGGGFIIIGGLLGLFALISVSFTWLIVGHFFLGSGIACMGYMRFAAAEAVEEKFKPSAMSLTLASGLVATLIASEIFSATKDTIGGTPLAGAYLAVAVLGLLGCFVLMGVKIKAEAITPSADIPTFDNDHKTISIKAVLNRKPVRLAIISAALSAAIMTFMMVPTPLAMIDHGHSQNHAGSVISWHLIAMFAPGFFTGWLIQRFGNVKIILVGLFLMLTASAFALIDGELLNFYVSLFLLGMGWNFGFTGGSHLLQQSLSVAERGKLQGINDTLIALLSTFASLIAGVVIANLGWDAIAIFAALFVVIGIFITLLNLPKQIEDADEI